MVGFTLKNNFFFVIHFGSNKTLQAHLGKPSYVWPYTLKKVVREAFPGDYVCGKAKSNPCKGKFKFNFLNFLINNGFEN